MLGAKHGFVRSTNCAEQSVDLYSASNPGGQSLDCPPLVQSGDHVCYYMVLHVSAISECRKLLHVRTYMYMYCRHRKQELHKMNAMMTVTTHIHALCKSMLCVVHTAQSMV